jgi:ribosomal protein S26
MYARAFDCPNCGAAVPFDSAIAVSAVCGFCRSVAVRHGAQVELYGRQAQLPPDLSPLRIGTQGSFDGHRFTLLGRVRVAYAEGSWNEWFAEFGDGRWGWVAESMGLYQVSFELAAPPDLPSPEQVRRHVRAHHPGRLRDLKVRREPFELGSEVTLGERRYTVRDLKETEWLGAEGALPFVPQPGRKAVSADLAGEGTEFANVEFAADGARLFVGRVCRFEELGFGELRPLPGWGADAETTRGETTAVNCAQCGAAVPLRAAGLTMSVTCPACGTVLDTSHPPVTIVQRAAGAETPDLRIPLGRRGRLFGTEYECVGFQRRLDGYGESWGEYLLFNPFAGFRWLVTFNRHWSFVELLPAPPRFAGAGPVLEGQPYRLFARSSAQVTYVLGEFYWRVKRGEEAEVADYVAPPHVLSCESYPGLVETTWSHGRYVERAEVAAAFGLADLGEPGGIYLNQPNPHAERGRTLRWLLPVLAAAWFVIALAAASTRDRAQVLAQTWTHVAGGTNAPWVSEPFELAGRRSQAVEFRLAAGVNNGWLEAAVDLVNETNQSVRELALEVGHYSGWEGGESWQEGRQDRTQTLPAVAPGRYRLVVETGGDPGSPEVPVTLTVVRDVMVWSNVWLGLAALLAYPVFRWVREHAFERARWAQSDYSPHTPLDFAGGDDD